MEQIATVQPTPRRAERSTSAHTSAALLSDPFLLIFQQMMESATGPESGENSGQEPAKDGEEQQEAAMMQVLSGVLLSGTPAPVVLDKTQELPNAQTAPAIPQVLSTDMQIQSPAVQAQVATLPLTASPSLAETPLVPSARPAGSNQTAGSAQPTAAEAPSIPILQTEFRTQSGETQTGAHSEQGYDASSQFKSQQGVAEVKRQLASTRSSLRTQSGDGDVAATSALQPHTQAPAPSAALAQKAEQVAAEPRLLDQLKTGLKEHLTTDKSEFTMKLKPESLGEITVKLTEKAGKTTLTIVTASAQTAKLINADLSALREAVRPMQVEVREAIPQQSESPQAQMHQFDMSGQQHLFQQQQQQHQQQHSGNRYQGSFFPQESEILPPDEHLDTALLDTYI